MTCVTFNERIAELREGNPEAWRAMWAELAPRLMRYFERFGVDHHMAEDFSQDVLAQVFKKLCELRRPERFDSWVKAIARNLVRSRLRRARALESCEPDRRCVDADPLAALLGRDLMAVIREEIAALRPHLRRITEMRLMDGCTPVEVSAVLGIPRGLQRRRLYVAMRDLRRRLENRSDALPESVG